MSLGERLKVARESTKKSQRDFAELLGISFRGLQTYESGSSVPGGNILSAYAELGFNVNWILLGEGPMHLEVNDSSLYFLQNNELLDNVIMAIDEYLLEIREVLPIAKKRELIKALYRVAQDLNYAPNKETIASIAGLLLAH
jgi:transcriptional regulator with XRE-family HTH domain